MTSTEAHINLCNSLVAAERVWEATVDALTDAVYIFGPDKRLTRINQTAEFLERANRSFLIGRRCCDMLWRFEGASCMVDRAMSNGAEIDVELDSSNKARRPLQVRVIPQKSDAQQEAGDGCVVIARDISELRKAEEETSKNRAFLASLADLAPDEIYTLDTDHRFTWMNRRAESDTGLTRSVLLGQDFNMIVSMESKAVTETSLDCTLRGEQKQFELRTICADGRVRCMEAHTSPLWHDGSITGVMVFMSDVTERKLAQECAARSDKLRALGELAAGVAHNLNNSLTVIQGRAQLLLMRGGADDPHQKSLEVITQAVGDCSQTLRRLLDFSRRKSTRVTLPVDLSELVTSSVEIARPKWQAESPTRIGAIEVRVDAPRPVMALGDPSELREVVLNLIFNAVDAMTHGGAIEIGTCAEGESARFWVADNGAGMAPEVLARIFEPFYSTKGDRGTGLGLSASHGIIDNHGGDINVFSEVGRGTRFEVVLPLSKTGASIVAEGKAEPVEPKSARILVVEDEEKVRVLLNDAFRTGGHEVTEATTGAEALRSLDGKEFDLMVCDLGLPELSGLHVARWVKEFRPNMPVIIATGFAEMIAQEDYNHARIDDVISKPYAVADVLARANAILLREGASDNEIVIV
ncbi:MAG: ATP-binding protein [Pyrinomonadaceae bacterium]